MLNTHLLLGWALLSILTLSACSDDVDDVAAVEPTKRDTDVETIVLDGYKWGIRTYELTIDGNKVAVRKKDIPGNVWGPEFLGTLADLEDNENFRFDGSLVNFPAKLNTLSKINWGGLSVAAPLGSQSQYVRHRELREMVGNDPVVAHHWAQQDSERRTMDIIVGTDNTVLGALDPSNDAVLIRRGYENFTTIKQWREASVSQPLYGYTALKKVMMPTRGGPKLATLVYLPDGDVEGPFPTVLIRTPYGITGLIKKYEHYAARGYAVVIQAVQGTIHWDQEGRSEGNHFATINEPGDGADVISWIADQAWSNDSICTLGISYLGFTQWTAAMAGNPALKCLIPESTLGTAFSDQPYMGGTFV